MIKVGITGGIGSGKTTVCNIFETLGIPVYYADNRAKWLMTNDSTLKSSIVEMFGIAAYTENGELNREYLAKTIFSSTENTQKINQLVHPVVGEDFSNWCEQKNSKYVLKEAALLFESGSNKSLDYVITVSCSEELRIKRVLKRDPQRNVQDIKNIISKQWPEKLKIKESDFIIDNNGDEMIAFYTENS